MQYRVYFFIFIAVFCSSCQFINPDRKDTIQQLDTVIDFTSVDTFPAFDICKGSIDKNEQISCFRKTIHEHITATLLEERFAVKKPLNDSVFVHLLINRKGKVTLKQIESSLALKKLLPRMDSLIKVSINKLPKLFPAIKRGIPVATQYKLPIHVYVN